MKKTTLPIGLAIVMALSSCTSKESDFQASFQRFVPWETENSEELLDVNKAAEEFVESATQSYTQERDYSYSSNNKEERHAYEQSLRESEDNSYSDLYKSKREARRAYDTGEAYRNISSSSDDEWESHGGYSQEQENYSHVIEEEEE